MRKINVQTINGDVLETVYTVSDFQYEDLHDLDINRKKQGKDIIEYYNIACAFDIEATTIKPPTDKEGNYVFTPYAFMYHWQACIKNHVVFGRTWREFTQFLSYLQDELKLDHKRRLVFYVHNLAYEFQFIKDFIQIDSLFAKDKRKPLKFVSRGIEFRCSYFLSNRSFQSFCEVSEGCIHYKLTDTYDYSKVRTPSTPLTEEEEAYCYNDVRGLCECIESLMLEDTIATMPLTNTGYVRREYRYKMKTTELRRKFLKTRLNPHEYKMLKKAFRGGNTHANRFYSNMIIKDAYSFDISSSYPACMMMDDYPMGKFSAVTLDSQGKLDYYTQNYCVVMEISFVNITLNNYEVVPYIDIAHCEQSSKIANDNGRVLRADYIRMTITNIDLDIIRNTYSYDYLIVHRAMYSERGKLHDEFRKKMMDFYEAKTLLKGIEGEEYNYMKSKNRLNSSYGMTVTDLAHSEITYDQETMVWLEEKPNIQKALDDFYESRNNFLWYQWGVFVTANARKRLQHMLDIVKEDVIYTDTDSIKFIGEEHIKEFEDYNNQLISQAESNDIPAYVDRDDERFYLGTWDNDGNYLRFKTLGAKKYAYEYRKKKKHIKKFKSYTFKKGCTWSNELIKRISKSKTRKFVITVSGMGKKKGAKQVGCIENFEIGRTFSDIGRTTSWYNDSEIKEITVHGDTFITDSNIAVLENTYTLGVTNEYWELIFENGILLN